jgi:hypothetical protein
VSFDFNLMPSYAISEKNCTKAVLVLYFFPKKYYCTALMRSVNVAKKQPEEDRK